MLAAELDLSEERDFEALTKRLAAMVRDGQLIQNRRSGYGVAQKLDLIPGVVLANPDGYGFLRPDKGGGEDLYLSPFEMKKVLHGDRALGSVIGADRRGRKQGAIVEAEITDSPNQYRGPIGRVMAVLGERLTPSLVVEMAIASHDLPHEWPDPVLREAADVSPVVTALEAEGRKDIRGMV